MATVDCITPTAERIERARYLMNRLAEVRDTMSHLESDAIGNLDRDVVQRSIRLDLVDACADLERMLFDLGLTPVKAAESSGGYFMDLPAYIAERRRQIPSLKTV